MLLTLHCPDGEFHLEVPTGWNTAQLRSCLVEATGLPHLQHQDLHTVHGPLSQAQTTGVWPLVPGSSLATAPHFFPNAEVARHRTNPAQQVVVAVTAGAGFGQLVWLAPGPQVAIAGAKLRLSRSGRIRLRSASRNWRAPARTAKLRPLSQSQPVPHWWELSSPAWATHAAAANFGGAQFVAVHLAPGVAGAPPPCCGPAPIGSAFGGPKTPGREGRELDGALAGDLGPSSDKFGRSAPHLTSARTSNPAAKNRRVALLHTGLVLVPSLAMIVAAWFQGSVLFAIGAVAGAGAAISSLIYGGLGGNKAELPLLELAKNSGQREISSFSGPLVLSGSRAHERAFAAAQAMGGSARLRIWHPRATAGLWSWQQLLPASDSWHLPRSPTCHFVDLSCGAPTHPDLDLNAEHTASHLSTTLSADELWLAQFQKTLPPGDLLIVVQPHKPDQQPDSSTSWWLHSTELAVLTAWARAVNRRQRSEPSGVQSTAGTLLPDLGITAQWGQDPELALDSWSAAGDDWFVPLTGPDQSALNGLDLVTDGPHALVAGTTGSGKSALLRTWLLALCAKHSPRRLQLALIDYKGTGSFGPLVDFPHVVGSANNLDRELTMRAFGALSAEVLDRQRLLARHEVTDFLQLPDSLRPARLVFAVDEAAALLDQHPELSQELKLIAAQGRSLGIHLILATQRAGSAISAQVRANISLRICLRVADSADSLDVLDHPGAADLPAQAPGSALVSIGGAAPLLLRAAQNRWSRSGRSAWKLLPQHPPARSLGDRPHSSTSAVGAGTDALLSEEECLNQLAATMRRAADRLGATPAQRLWRPPLPDLIPLPGLVPMPDLVTLPNRVPMPNHTPLPALEHHINSPPFGSSTLKPAALALGVADLLDEREQPELCWLPAHGHLLISGGPGSGRTSALVTVGMQAGAAGYHVDSYGLDPEKVSLLPPMGSHLRTDPTGLIHLIDRFEEAAGSGQPYLLLVDGWTAALQDLAALPRGSWTDRLEGALLLRGAARLAVATWPNPGSLAQNINQRLVLRSADSTSVVFAGVPSSWPAPAIPGRAVALGFAPASVLTAQLYLPQTAALPPAISPGLARTAPDSTDQDRLAPSDLAPNFPTSAGPTAYRRPQLKTLPLLLGAASDDTQTSLGVIGPQAAPLRPDPRRNVLLVAPQGAGPTGLLESWPQAPGALVIDRLDEQLQAMTVSESGLAQELTSGTPIVATVSTHALLNTYSGILANLRRSADLLVLDPLTDGGLELFDSRHYFLTSALLRGRNDLGIYRQDSRAWQVQIFGVTPH